MADKRLFFRLSDSKAAEWPDYFVGQQTRDIAAVEGSPRSHHAFPVETYGLFPFVDVKQFVIAIWFLPALVKKSARALNTILENI